MMMKIEDLVTGLEKSKELQEIGIEQDSFFYWYKHALVWTLVYRNDLPEGLSNEEKISAFTNEELSEMLKNNVEASQLKGIETAIEHLKSELVYGKEVDIRAGVVKKMKQEKL